MKSASTALKNHFGEDCTTLAVLWKVTKKLLGSATPVLRYTTLVEVASPGAAYMAAGPIPANQFVEAEFVSASVNGWIDLFFRIDSVDDSACFYASFNTYNAYWYLMDNEGGQVMDYSGDGTGTNGASAIAMPRNLQAGDKVRVEAIDSRVRVLMNNTVLWDGDCGTVLATGAANATRAGFDVHTGVVASNLKIGSTESESGIMGFTTHDQDIVYNGVTYLASTGFTNTASETKSDLSVDNLEVTGFLDSEIITEEDIRAGFYDNAEVEERVVNWADLSMGDMILRIGNIGNISMKNGVFTAEMRGLTQKLSTLIGNTYGPVCRAEFGSQPAAQTSYTYTATVPATSRPWNTSNNPDYDYGSLDTDGTAPVELPVALVAGQIISLTATGSAQASSIWSDMGPDGDSWLLLGVLDIRLGSKYPGLFINSGSTLGHMGLCGAFVNNSYQVVSAVAIKSSSMFVVPAGATKLILGVNELGGAFSNNLGSFSVTAIVENPSATRNRYYCRVNLANYRQSGTISSVTSSTVVVPTAGLLQKGSSTPSAPAPDGWFNDGILAFTSGVLAGRCYEIKDWDGTNLTFFLPLPKLPSASDSFTIEPGCDGSAVTCYEKYNNIINFRGEPFIPGNDVLFSYPNSHDPVAEQ